MGMRTAGLRFWLIGVFTGCWLVVLPGCRTAPRHSAPTPALEVSNSNYLAFKTNDSMAALFRYQPGCTPLVSAHRGGPLPGYPENCLETFANTLATGPAILEVDVRQTQDGFFVLMHDARLERTTTGTGYVAERPLAYLKRLKLKDNRGEITPYQVPTLDEAMAWAKGKTVLLLDIKRDVDAEKLLSRIVSFDAQRYVHIIPNDYELAEWLHRHDPDLWLSVNARSLDEWARLKTYPGIDLRRVVAWVGTQPPALALVDTLHARGIRVDVGTLGNLDKLAATQGPAVYARLRAQGADILAADSVVVVQRFLQVSR